MIYLLISNIFTVIAVIIAYSIGLRNRQAIDNKENVKIIPSPVDSYRKYRKEKENQEEIEKLNTIMNNIDNYDGTGKGQVEVSK